MHSRRVFLTMTLGATVLFTSMAACGGGETTQKEGHVKSATAIAQVFGDGQRLTAVAVEFDQDIDNSKLSMSTFKVDGLTITKVYANTAAITADKGTNGKYAIVELSPDDQGAALYAASGRTVTRREAKTSVTQTGTVATTDGDTYAASTKAIATSKVANLIVDDFKQFEYKDPKTGEILKYNLFIPKNYDKSKSYPLVLFMHDAGATSTVTTTTLVQGLGAVVWASPSDQAKHESFVLAPQYSTQVVNDNSEASDYLDTTVNLVNWLVSQYSIDKNRLYTTGQSGGAMMSIAMDIKYPDLFAASFIVAGQWEPTKVKPLAKDKLWIVVSQGDLKAYPGQNAIATALEKEGAKVSRAVWNGRSTAAEFATAVKKMETEGNSINYVALKKGTVVLTGQKDDGGSNHINTWRIAYAIEGIRDWIFKQHK
ncbi:MAG: prolyl oligopeptidase family serine peptidase [Nostoc sp. NMS1]|uniref:alpha/beta hydrolase-fold protein n=1 Tax=unclassified Nostoc TaxID=2593658 RepID=UPI0025D38906|nr:MULTISPECIES: PHB depolymerase family esterase [unclassified Nostoc]MBN3908585.1 prolyl oligopeptidase family serine peptidase [Nostoc sp. NMS1]MBN3994541.1 prolyl oligopeptidase family serine peptidase [Nostoc sp. NMS2]